MFCDFNNEFHPTPEQKHKDTERFNRIIKQAYAKKECATKRALEAQRKLYEEAYPFHDVGGYDDMDEIAFGTNDTSDNR